MRLVVVLTRSAVIVTLITLVEMGCRDREPSSSQAEEVDTKEGSSLTALERRVGVTFPVGAVVIYAGDGGGRDQAYDFYEWAVFAPSAVEMPLTRAPGVTDYLKLPLEDTVRFVQERMQKRVIFKPLSAFGSEWKTNNHSFRGTCVRASQGDYLVIEQFRE